MADAGHRPALSAFRPAPLSRYPFVLASLLAAMNRGRRAVATRRRVGLLVAAAILCAGGAAAALAAVNGRLAALIAGALDHARLAVIASGLYAALLVTKLRRRGQARRARFWLAATPRTDPGHPGVRILPVALPALGRYAAVLAAVLLCGLAAAVPAHAARLAGWLALGGVAGGLAGSVFPLRTRKPRPADSRFAGSRATGRRFEPSARALSRWPAARALAWNRPENVRFWLAAALLSVPGGTGILRAVLLVLLWVVAAYLVALLAAVPRVGRKAMRWLRATPVTFAAFARPIAWRVLLHQVGGTVALVALTVWLGVSPADTLYPGMLWLTVVGMTLAIALADCYRARPPVVKAAASVFVVLLIEVYASGWGIALALALVAWHLRSGMTHVRP